MVYIFLASSLSPLASRPRSHVHLHPLLELGGEGGAVLDPCLWAHHEVVLVAVEPCAPPAEAAVGDDVMVAAGHQVHVLIAVATPVVAHQAELYAALLHEGLAPCQVVAEDVEDGVGDVLLDVGDGTVVVVGCAHHELGVLQVVATADVDGHALAAGHLLAQLLVPLVDVAEGEGLAHLVRHGLKVAYVLPVASDQGLACGEHGRVIVADVLHPAQCLDVAQDEDGDATAEPSTVYEA